ncbi:MAG: molybdopterin-binding protein [Maricaulaceae bacterium]|jgi:molybdenum cofactor synthesis domain-containing protein
MPEKTVTAAVLLIGDELLSGRTRDANLQAIAQYIGPLGVQVREARTVPDVAERIVAAVNELRAAYDYVITTGGIGPTHDDITADSIAAAFGVEIGERQDMLDVIAKRYGEAPEGLNDARRRMARAPAEAKLVRNPVSGAPGFQMENVFVLAGVPGIMKGMLEDVGPRLEGGLVMKSRSVRAKGVREGEIGGPLEALQNALQNVALGSYPFFRMPAEFGVTLVARSTDETVLDAAVEALVGLVRAAGGEPEVDPEE